MNHAFPWAELTTPMYEAVEVKHHKKWVIVGSWILAAVLVVGGFTTRFKIAFVFAALLVLTMISKKTVMITERGLESFMEMRITSQYELWKWSEIEAITHQKLAEYPGMVQLYFTKDVRTRRLFFTEKDAAEIRKLAKQKNSKIWVYDGTAYMDSYKKQQQLKQQAKQKGRKK